MKDDPVNIDNFQHFAFDEDGEQPANRTLAEMEANAAIVLATGSVNDEVHDFWYVVWYCYKLALNIVTLDDFVPSRFAIAFDHILDVAFVALDPERIGEAVDDGMMTDLGDNVLTYKTNFTVNDRVNATEEEEEDVSVGEESDNSSVESDDDDDEDVELATGKTNSLNTLIQFLNYNDVRA